MSSKETTVGAILLSMAIMAGIIAIMGVIVQQCWNFVMPYLFGLPQMNFLQTIAFVVLVVCLGGLTRSGKTSN